MKRQTERRALCAVLTRAVRVRVVVVRVILVGVLGVIVDVHIGRRQQMDFREVHQQDLMKHLELQKFQNSAFDDFTQKKFIEDQKTIMELSGRLQ